MTTNGNNTSARLVWGILGIFGTCLLLVGTAIFTKLDRLDTRSAAQENAITRMQEQMRQVDDIARLTRTEQVERTSRFGEISNRLNLLEQLIRSKQLEKGSFP